MLEQIWFSRYLRDSYSQIRGKRLTVGHDPALNHPHCEPEFEAVAARLPQRFKRGRGATRLFEIRKAKYQLVFTCFVESTRMPPERAAARIAKSEVFTSAELPPQNRKQTFLEISLHQGGDHP